MKPSDQNSKWKARLNYANLGLGLIIFIVGILSAIYGESTIRTIVIFVFAAAFIYLGIRGIENFRSKK